MKDISNCLTASAVAAALGFAPNAHVYASALPTTAREVAASLGFTTSSDEAIEEATARAMNDYMDRIRSRARAMGYSGVIGGEPMNSVRGQAQQEDVDYTDYTDEGLELVRARFENLIERIDADASGREFTAREEDRRETAQNHLALVEAEIERRATPRGRRAGPDHMPSDSTTTRAQLDAGRGGRSPRASMPAQPRSAAHGMGGFQSAGQYLQAVIAGSQKGATPDQRLIMNAVTSYGSEGIGQDGGFAVPPDFRTEIVKKVLGEDSLLSRTDQMITSSNSIVLPTDETTPWQTSGGIQAYWESEAGQKQQSKPQLTEKTVKANKIIALVPLTDELLQDAPGMAAYVSGKAPEKIDSRVNDAILNGTGVGQPLGFLQSGALITVAAEGGQAADTVTFNNIVDMYSRATASTQRNGVWLANSDLMSQFLKMQFPGTGTAVPAYLPPGGLSAAPYGSLMGRPVIPVEAAAAVGDVGDLSFVDLSQYMTVLKSGGVRQDVSIHLFFDYDITAFRFVLRVGGQPWWNAPITRLNGNSRSPFIALAAR